MDLNYGCLVEGANGCDKWSQEGLTGTKDEPDAFKVAMGFTCIAHSDKGYCKTWTQEGTAIKEGSSGCFPGSSLVLSRNGPMPMSKVSIGDEILGMDHNSGAAVYSTVRAWLHRETETESDMTALTTATGRVVASAKHSLATDDGRYVFADTLSVGDHLLAADGTRMPVLEKRREIARGLYSPFTGSSNYFVGESEKSMILAHNFAHVERPQWFAFILHRIFDVAEFIWPQVHEVQEGDSRYAHPIVHRLAPLIGIYL